MITTQHDAGLREPPETVEEQQGKGEPRPATEEAQEGAQRPWWRKLIGR